MMADDVNTNAECAENKKKILDKQKQEQQMEEEENLEEIKKILEEQDTKHETKEELIIGPPIISNKEYFEFLVKTTKKTVRQEDVLIRQILYAGFSAFTDDPINLGVMGPTSEGKTYPIMETFQYFPNDIVWNIGKMSTMVLVRKKGILVDSNNQPIESKVLELKQKISIEKDEKKISEFKEQISKLRSDATHLIDLNGKILVFLEQPKPDLWEIIKPILSHDNKEISFDYVDNEKPRTLDGDKVQKVIVRGWPAFVYCSAKDESNWSVWPEIQSRFLISSPNMRKEKYEESNLLIAQRKGLPSFIQEQVIVSEHDRKASKDCVSHLIQQLNAIQLQNSIWIHYGEILAEALKAEKGTDVRNAKRIFSFLNIIPLVKSECRQRLSINGNTSIIAMLDDLSEVLAITQNLNGIPAFKMKFLREIFCPKFYSKKEPDKSKDGKIEEDEIAVTTKDLKEYYRSKFGKIITTDSIRKTYLNELHNNGLIEEEESKIDKRQNIYKPLISLDDYNDYHDDMKIKKLREWTPSHNFLQHSPIILPRNCNLPAENWLIMQILTFLKYGIDQRSTSNGELIQLEDIQILNPYGTTVSIKDFVSHYEQRVSLIPYFKKPKIRNYHSELFGDMKYLNSQWKKDIKNCGNDSNPVIPLLFDPLNTTEIESQSERETEADLNIEEMNFVPISSQFNNESGQEIMTSKPAGATYICKNCNEQQYSLCWELHKKSCPRLNNNS